MVCSTHPIHPVAGSDLRDRKFSGPHPQDRPAVGARQVLPAAHGDNPATPMVDHRQTIRTVCEDGIDRVRSPEEFHKTRTSTPASVPNEVLISRASGLTFCPHPPVSGLVGSEVCLTHVALSKHGSSKPIGRRTHTSWLPYRRSYVQSGPMLSGCSRSPTRGLKQNT